MAVGLIQLALLAMALFTVVVATLSATVYPRLRHKVMRAEPADRARAILTLCVLPAVAAAGLTALCFVPKMFATFWPGFEHCAGHAHPHFCFEHAPQSPGGVLGWLVAASLAAPVFFRVLQRLVKLARSRRYLRQLVQAAAFDRSRGIWVVEAEGPWAVTAGLVRPRTVVSAELLRSLPPELVDAAIEHERAHARRRDGLLKVVASILSLGHLSRTRLVLLRDLDLAMEQACDEEAGVELGDRLRVARALLGLERLLHGTQVRFGLAGIPFGGSSLVPRVESLLAAPAPRTAHRKTKRWLVMAAVGAFVLLSDQLHHLTETILGTLIG